MSSGDRREIVRHLQEETHRLFLRRRNNALQLIQRIDPEIEPASYSVLSTLQTQGPQRMTAIAHHLGIGKPTLSRQLTTLAERGFITKSADPADGRAAVVDLTTQGRQRLEVAQEERSERYLDMPTLGQQKRSKRCLDSWANLIKPMWITTPTTHLTPL